MTAPYVATLRRVIDMARNERSASIGTSDRFRRNTQQSCCTDGTHMHSSSSTCEAALLAECEGNLEALTTNPVTGYDSEEAGVQIETLRQLAMLCDPAVSEWRVSQLGLFAVLQGTTTSGGDCSASELPSGEDGLWSAWLASCQRPDTCRISSITASPANVTGTCGSLAAFGEACYISRECASGLTCFPPDNYVGGGGTCLTPRTAGSNCVYDQNCASFNCGYDGKCAVASINGAYCLAE